jgi:hypothetical protein
MRRSILVIVIVAVLSAWIGRADRAAGVPRSPQDWIRTADGWEQRASLVVERPTQPTQVHPGLVAAFQLGVSLLVLLAFPGRAIPVAKPASVATRIRRPLAAPVG